MIDVVCGVIWSCDGRYLLAQRPAGRIWAGWWEFPGGKVEPGEPPGTAMRRELQEELGILATRADPWLLKLFDYPHARVRLHFFHIREWSGEPTGREGQVLHWQYPGSACAVGPLLPANVSVLRALTLPPLVPVTPPPELPHHQALRKVARALASATAAATAAPKAAGHDTVAGWLQVRRGELTRTDWQDWVSLCQEHGLLPVANTTPDAAQALGARALHLKAARLATLSARPAGDIVGASVHGRAELEHAAALGLDYVILGSVKSTASHPGRAGLGWPVWARLAEWSPLPVYAIGGLGASDLDTARRFGASGVAMIGAAWDTP